VAEPRLKEVLIDQNGAAGSSEMIREAHKAGIVIVLGTETEEHSDSAVSCHDVV
jgi:hypothetical protein